MSQSASAGGSGSLQCYRFVQVPGQPMFYQQQAGPTLTVSICVGIGTTEPYTLCTPNSVLGSVQTPGPPPIFSS